MSPPTPSARAVRLLTAAPRATKATQSVNGYERESKRSSAGPRQWVDLGKRGIEESTERSWPVGGWARRIIFCAWRSWRSKPLARGTKRMPRELKIVPVESSPPIYSFLTPMFLPSPTDLPTKFSSFIDFYYSE